MLPSPHRRRRALLLFRGLSALAGALAAVVFIVAVAFVPSSLEGVWAQDSQRVSYRLSGRQYCAQTLAYLKQLSRLSLGEAQVGYDRVPVPVADTLRRAAPRSVILVGASLAMSVAGGFLLGALASRRTVGGRLLGVFGTMAALSVPDFLVVLLVQLLMLVFVRHGYFVLPVVFAATPRHAILPSVTLAILPAAHVARLTAVAFDRVLHQDYIRTACAKGCSEPAVLFRHALKNAAGEVLGGLPGVVALIFSGLLIVEYLYVFPGAGYHLIYSVEKASSPTAAGMALFLALLFTLIEAGIILARRAVDPRGR